MASFGTTQAKTLSTDYVQANTHVLNPGNDTRSIKNFSQEKQWSKYDNNAVLYGHNGMGTNTKQYEGRKLYGSHG